MHCVSYESTVKDIKATTKNIKCKCTASTFQESTHTHTHTHTHKTDTQEGVRQLSFESSQLNNTQVVVEFPRDRLKHPSY